MGSVCVQGFLQGPGGASGWQCEPLPDQFDMVSTGIFFPPMADRIFTSAAGLCPPKPFLLISPFPPLESWGVGSLEKGGG